MKIFNRDKKEKDIKQQSKELIELADKVDNFIDSAKKYRQPEERQWYMNLAFLLGYQNIRWIPELSKFRAGGDPNDPPHRKRYVGNKILPNVMRGVGKLTRNRPIPVVIPATSQDNDRNKARVSEKVLAHLYRLLKMQGLNQELFMNMFIYGSAFKDHLWDPTAGKKISEEDNIGEVAVEVLSPFSILVPPGSRDMADVNKLVKLKSRSLDWIRERYPVWGPLVEAESKAGETSAETELRNLIQNPAYSYEDKGMSNKKEGFCTVKEYRQAPCKDYPNGLLVVVANKIVLESHDLPFQYFIDNKRLGIVKYDFIKIPDKFWGVSPITDAIPPQIEYNKTRSIVHEHKNIFKGKWIIAKGHGIKSVSPDNETGEVIVYDEKKAANAPPPHQSSPTPLPSYLENDIERSIQDIQDTFSQHEISKAQTPAGITSGVALEVLAEQDDTPYGPIVHRFEECESEAAMYLLNIVKEKYDEPRQLILVGENKEIQVQDFIKSEDMPTDVIIQPGSALPQLKSSKIANILDFASKGVFGPEDKKGIIKALEFGELENFFEEINVDEQRAIQENQKLESDNLIPERISIDNPVVHLGKHEEWLKSNWDSLTLQQKDSMLKHCALHEADIPKGPMPGAEGQVSSPDGNNNSIAANMGA